MTVFGQRALLLAGLLLCTVPATGSLASSSVPNRTPELSSISDGRISEVPTKAHVPFGGPDISIALAFIVVLALVFVLGGIIGSVLRRKYLAGILLILLGFPGVALLAEGGIRVSRWLLVPSFNDETFQIFAVGGSTMQGAPYPPRFSPPAFLSSVFDGWIGARPIEIRNIARHGWSVCSESVLLERAVAGRDPGIPGVLMVYAGHNEGRVFPGSSGPSGLLDEIENVSAAVREWRLVFPPALDPINQFSRSETCLRRVIKTALGAGLVPLLSTAPSNHSGMEPTVPLDIDPGSARMVLAAGRALEDEGRLEEASAAYLKNSSDDGLGALLAFRAAGCLHRAGLVREAAELYDRAIDIDLRTRFGRASAAQNDLIRRLANEYRVPLVDTDRRFRAASPDGIPGNELFSDGHHPSLRGYRLMADSYAQAVTRVFRQPPIRAFDASEDPCQTLVCSLEVQASAHVAAANWRIAASVRHPDPREALAAASQHLQRAIELVPNDPAPWLGMAVLDAAQRGGMLWDESDIERLSQWNFGFSGHPCVSAGRQEGMLVRMRELEVAPGILKQIKMLWESKAEDCPETGGDS